MSQALQLVYMRERPEVIRVIVLQCFFDLRDPENGKPYQKKTALDVNDRVMANALAKDAVCRHGPEKHQVIQGQCQVNGSMMRRSAWVAGKVVCPHSGGCRGRPDGIPSTRGDALESSGCMWPSMPEENLRLEMQKNDLSGERYDYITFVGDSLQQPRRLRSMVAHLHVTLGHLSNDRLARMFVLSGGQEAVVKLARNLKCQICAMVRPPGATPQVSYKKPQQFNESISGDSFHVWDLEGKKFMVTHYIDGLTDYHVGDLTVSREVLQDLWYGVFGPPDVLVTDGGPEFAGTVAILNDLFGVVHEVVPEGAKWRSGQAERHGAIVKLMIMRMTKEMSLKGVADMRKAAIAAFSAKNRICNRGGVSPLQAVTGRNSMLPGSLMEQLTSGQVRFRYNEAVNRSEAIAKGERIRAGAVAAYHWLDAHESLRRALSSRSRPPALEAIKEGTVVYVYDPPSSRRGLARRLQDHSSWTGPGIVVCVEREQATPHRLWIRVRGRVKGYPLEKVRLATVDEQVSAQFLTDALKQVEDELRGGRIQVEEGEAKPSKEAEPVEEGESRGPSSADESSSEDEKKKTERAKRARLLEDVPYSVRQNLEQQRKRQAETMPDPHTLEFDKKKKLFESLAKSFEAPTKLQEAQLRNQMEKNYAKVKAVRKIIRQNPKKKRDGGHRQTRGAASQASADVLAVEGEIPVYFKPGEFEAMIQDTVGQWTLWGSSSQHSGSREILEVSAQLGRQEWEGVTEVTTGKARAEYRWGDLDEHWRKAYVPPLKKAVGVYLEHNGIRGVPQGPMVDPSRVLSSRFALTNKGGPTLAEAELKARWIFGGHRDPDAGLYATSSPTASVLGHNLWRCSKDGRCTMRMCRQLSCRAKSSLEERRST